MRPPRSWRFAQRRQRALQPLLQPRDPREAHAEAPQRLSIVAVSGDGRTEVSGVLVDGAVRVCDLAGTAALRVLTGHRDGVYSVAVSAEGRTGVSRGQDGTAWDLAGTAPPRVLAEHTGPVLPPS